MLLDGLDEDLDARQADRAQPLGESHADLGADAARAPVGDAALRVDGAEVAARGDVARPQVELNAERLQHAAADLEANRIVAEEAEVPRPAARRDAGRDVAEQATGRLRGESGQVGHAGRLELRAPRFGAREAAEPVEREKDDLRGVRHHERANEIQHGFSVPESATLP